jgi:hypothetical protein
VVERGERVVGDDESLEGVESFDDGRYLFQSTVTRVED